ncbi:MAG: SUF system NifU family Fe-S cluster assembly protein [Ectothiorhodospiraceae bacterium]
MADELFRLYQGVVLDHNRSPRNYRVLDRASHQGHGYNPLCGDRIDLMLEVVDGRIEHVAFQGDSCAIATASASLLTEVIKGRRVSDAAELIESFRQALDGDTASLPEQLEPLLAVRSFPSRIKCAQLPWASLETALGNGDTATTDTR